MAKTKIIPNTTHLPSERPLTILEKVTSWAKNNRSEAFFLAITLIIGSLLRLYRIDEYMTFLGDEGRDAIVVRKLLVNFDPILVGPGTSIGNMYLGPLYYYLIAPFLLFANFSPVGPSVMVALLSILTIYLVWHVSRLWFGKIGGIATAVLYAISPIVIIYSRSSWNPNILPFFSLMSIYATWRILKFNEFNWLVVLGVTLALALNSHYLALVLFPVVGVFLLFKLILLYKAKGSKDNILKNKFLRMTYIGLILFAFLMSPLLIFDSRHEWRNFNAMKTFFTERQTTVSAKPWSSLPYVYPNFEKINTRLLTGTDNALGKPFTLFMSAFLLINFYIFINGLKKTKIKWDEWFVGNSHYLLLIAWMAAAFVGLGIYKQEIYDHYYGFFFTAPFLVFGAVIAKLFKSNKVLGGLLSLLVLLALLFVNIKNSPLKDQPNRQMQRSEEVSHKIIEESGGKDFNIAVIAERNYEGAYQYFLEKEDASVKMIDPQLADETITDQLFVICELPKEKCEPTTNPKAGIANFGWSKVDKEWEVAGVILYKLIHY